MKCEDFKDRIVDALYDELRGKDLEDLLNHLNGCSACASLYNGMKATVNIMEKRKGPEMDPSFSAGLWGKIDPLLSPAKTRKISTVFTWRPAAIPSWAYSLAAVFLIVVGIFVGRTYFTPTQISPAITSTDLQTASAFNDTTSAQALAYLKRSKNFLLGVANAPADEETALDPARSRQLVDQANVLYATLNRPEQQQMRRLIDALRIILIQLSNIEVRPGVPAVELVQKSIDRKSIFLKINIEELRAMSNQPAGENKTKEQNI